MNRKLGFSWQKIRRRRPRRCSHLLVKVRRCGGEMQRCYVSRLSIYRFLLLLHAFSIAQLAPRCLCHVPGLGCLVRKPALLASIRAIVGTVTSTHLAENLLRGDLDEIQGGPRKTLREIFLQADQKVHRRGSPPYI